MNATVDVLASTIAAPVDGIVTKEARPSARLEAQRYSPIFTFGFATATFIAMVIGIITAAISNAIATTEAIKMMDTITVPEVASATHMVKASMITRSVTTAVLTTAAVSPTYLSTELYTTVVVDKSLIHKTLGIILRNTILPVPNTTAASFVLRFEASMSGYS